MRTISGSAETHELIYQNLVAQPDCDPVHTFISKSTSESCGTGKNQTAFVGWVHINSWDSIISG
ncbi:MAG: hypothetical protein C0467_16645 [Planctomycetaceae bacterium]|nr:hypothetical protein [Planctomycetaceae bacterium]